MTHIADAQIVQVPSTGFTLPPINAHPIFPWPEKSMNNDRDRVFHAVENNSSQGSFSTLMQSPNTISHQRSSLPLPQGLHAYANYPTSFVSTQPPTSPIKLPSPEAIEQQCNTSQSAPQSLILPSAVLDLHSITNSNFQDQKKRLLLKNHPLMPQMRILLESAKKDCFPKPESRGELKFEEDDFSLESFLIAQGFDEESLHDADLQLTEEQEDDRRSFLLEVQQVRTKFQKEIEYLDAVSSKAVRDIENILHSQSGIRPPMVIEEQKASKTKSILQKFESLKTALRQQACSSVLVLQKRFHIQNLSKKRKNLPKKATQVLSDWFFDHIQDPYPSESEKIVLAAKGGLTLVQINYWFANKRIRYKKKCQEEEQKRKEKSLAKRIKHEKEVEVLKPTPQPIPVMQPSTNLPSSQPSYDNIKLVNSASLSPQRLTPSLHSLSKNVMHSTSSPFLFHDGSNNTLNNFPPLQVNRSLSLPSLPGISNLDFYDATGVAMGVPVPVPTFSDQRFPSFPPRSMERL